MKIALMAVMGTAWAGLASPSNAMEHRPGWSDSALFFAPAPHPKQQIENVFSIAVSIKAEGFDEFVSRNGGTAVYRFTGADGDNLVFAASARYDGQPTDEKVDKISKDGRNDCWGDLCRAYTDASGLLFNQFLWGKPPPKVRDGQSWEVAIDQAWEMGPASRQRISIVRLDPGAHVATLLRQGQGAGPTANEKKQVRITRAGKSYLVNVVPGPARWKGYTIFRGGFVQSDELLMQRQVKLVSPELGAIDASERIYMLLNAAPEGSV